MKPTNRVASVLAALESEREPDPSRMGRALFLLLIHGEVKEAEIVVSPTRPDLSRADGWVMCETPAGWIAGRFSPE